MTSPTGLRVEIGKRLGDFELDVAFDGAPEGVTTLFGPSGAGKSQVLAAIAGAARPDRGRIVLDGETLFDSEREILISDRENALSFRKALILSLCGCGKRQTECSHECYER